MHHSYRMRVPTYLMIVLWSNDCTSSYYARTIIYHIELQNYLLPNCTLSPGYPANCCTFTFLIQNMNSVESASFHQNKTTLHRGYLDDQVESHTCTVVCDKMDRFYLLTLFVASFETSLSPGLAGSPAFYNIQRTADILHTSPNLLYSTEVHETNFIYWCTQFKYTLPFPV